jgi:hypothetical protein
MVDEYGGSSIGIRRIDPHLQADHADGQPVRERIQVSAGSSFPVAVVRNAQHFAASSSTHSGIFIHSGPTTCGFPTHSTARRLV